MKTLLLMILGISNVAYGNGDSAATIEVQLGPNRDPTSAHDNASWSSQEEQFQSISSVDMAARAASNSSELITAWKMGMETANAIGRALRERTPGSSGNIELEITTINQKTPWAQLGIHGEGQYLAFLLDLKYWSALANKLPDTQAKTFFELAALSHDNASFWGWSNIHHRTWDYGGCSPLGTGIHRGILTKLDVIKQSPTFASQVGETLHRLRELVIKDLLSGMDEFPYCNRDKPEWVAKMIEEGRTIVATIELSVDERTTLQRRLDANMGLSVK